MVRHSGNRTRGSMVSMKQWWSSPMQEDGDVMNIPRSENLQGMPYAGDGAEDLEGSEKVFGMRFSPKFSRQTN